MRPSRLIRPTTLLACSGLVGNGAAATPASCDPARRSPTAPHVHGPMAAGTMPHRDGAGRHVAWHKVGAPMAERLAGRSQPTTRLRTRAARRGAAEAWCATARGAGRLVSDLQRVAGNGGWHPAPGTQCVVRGAWCVVRGACGRVPNANWSCGVQWVISCPGWPPTPSASGPVHPRPAQEARVRPVGGLRRCHPPTGRLAGTQVPAVTFCH